MRGKNLKPTKVLTVYTEESNAGYVEIADVVHGGMIGDFKPLSIAEANDIGQILMQKSLEIRLGIIPDNLLYFDFIKGSMRLAWVTAPCRKHLYFINNLHIPNGLYTLPAMLWIWRSDILYLYALETNNVDLQAPVYKSPFHNVYEDNSVCLGSGANKIKEKCSDVKDKIHMITTAFFESYFTHTHSSQILSNNLNLNTFWKSRVDIETPFPLDVLLPLHKTIKDVL